MQHVTLRIRLQSDTGYNIYQLVDDVLDKFGEVSFIHFYTIFSGIVCCEDDEATERLGKVLEQVAGDKNVGVGIKRRKFNIDDLRIRLHGSQAVPDNIESENQEKVVELIPGLILVKNFISVEEENSLLESILNTFPENMVPSNNFPKRRRVFHFGHNFNYATSRADDEDLNNWPKFLERIKMLVDEEVSKYTTGNYVSDQATINEYAPGEGIAKHVDTHSAFEDGIPSLSLGSDSVFYFANEDTKHQLFIERRSLFIMTKESRYRFTHQLPQRMIDFVDKRVKIRKTRLSLTFRKIQNTKCNCGHYLCDDST